MVADGETEFDESILISHQKDKREIFSKKSQRSESGFVGKKKLTFEFFFDLVSNSKA